MNQFFNSNIKNSRRAFTFLELLISVVIFVVVSLGSGWILMVFTKSADGVHKRVTARAAMIKSFDEVRQIAQERFDTLEDCQFPPLSEQHKSTCGFEDIGHVYPGFNRTLQVSSAGDGASLKQVDVTIEWEGLEKRKRISSSLYLNKPEGLVPGNLKGRVVNKENGEALGGIICVLKRMDAGGQLEVVSENVFSRQGCNINFMEKTGSDFLLVPGVWKLMVIDDEGGKGSYEQVFIVEPGVEKWVDIIL